MFYLLLNSRAALLLVTFSISTDDKFSRGDDVDTKQEEYVKNRVVRSCSFTYEHMIYIDGASRTAFKPSHHSALWWRISLLLIFVFASTLLLISFLNYSNYRKTYLNLNQTRYLVSIKELRQTIEYGINIGLPPSSNVYLQPALNDLLRRQSGIQYLAVIDDSNKVIGVGALPKKSAAEWRAPLESIANDSYYQGATDTTYQIGMPFINNFNTKAGVVVLGYDRIAIEASIEKMLTTLAIEFVINLAILIVLTLSVVYVLTRKFSVTVAKIVNLIGKATNPEHAYRVDEADIDSDAAKDLIDFVNLSQQASHELAIIEDELKLSQKTGAGMQEGLA